MSIKINYTNNISNKSSNNTVLFVDEKFNLNHLKKYISQTEFSFVNDLLKSSDLKKKIFNVSNKFKKKK